MGRILIGWELGLNLGHLSRLLPVATRLKTQGHPVLVAARDIAAAATVLGPADVSFVQAPHLPQGIPLQHGATGYADILLSQGWSDRSALWGLVQSWINLFRMFRPDVVVLDYSPTAQLAARIAAIPVVLIGNGFELPPCTDPLPPFPGFSWATQEKAAESERIAVGNAGAVAVSFKKPCITRLRDLFDVRLTRFATFPELDHYGPRQDATYIGPLRGAIKTQKIDWPDTPAKKIFACLRPNTQNVEAVLGALKQSRASVVCFAPGFPESKLVPFRSEHIRFTAQPVDLDHLARDADLCITYGAEGTTVAFLGAGVPQLMLPWQIENQMAARRIEAIHAGMAIRGKQNADQIASVLNRIVSEPEFRAGARAFMDRHGRANPQGNAHSLADEIAVIASENQGSQAHVDDTRPGT
jgi:UDP:flavonoid glycosyltransferase YjiC (YdhE family)